jgi:choline dehydrogenase-like flavoprotein
MPAGACEVLTLHEVPGGHRYQVDQGHSQERLDAWLDKIARLGVPRYTLPVMTAHQMGSCRMGARPGDGSACDPLGECWEVEGLYVADTSLFPTPSGANPMITCEAVAVMVAQGLAARLAGQGLGKGAGAGRQRQSVKVEYSGQ